MTKPENLTHSGNWPCILTVFTEHAIEVAVGISSGENDPSLIGAGLEGLDGYWGQETDDGGIAWRRVVDGACVVSKVSLDDMKIEASIFNGVFSLLSIVNRGWRMMTPYDSSASFQVILIA